MRYLSSFLELKLYRNKQFLLDAKVPKKPALNSKLTVMVKDRDTLYDTLNSGMFINRYYRSFFTDKMLRMKTVVGAMVTKYYKVSDIYKEVKENMPFVRNVFLKVSQYANKNIIFDSTSRIGTILGLKYASINTFLKQMYALMDTMHRDSRFKDYNKYYVFLIDDEKRIDVKYLNKPNIDTFNQAFIYRLMNEPETLIDWIGSTIIFTNTTGIFTYFKVTEDTIQGKFDKNILFRFLKTMWAFSASDADTMKEAEDLFEKETPDEAESKISHREKVLDEISKKLIPNQTVRSDMMKADILSKVTKDDSLDDDEAFDELEDFENFDKEDDEMQKAIDQLAEVSKNDSKKKSTNTKSKVQDDEDADPYDEDLDGLNDALDEESQEEIDDKEVEELYKSVVDSTSKKQLDKKTDKEIQKIKALQAEFDSVKFSENDKTFKELVDGFKNTQIEPKEFPVKTRNKSIRCATGQAATKAYYEKQLDSDIAMVFKMFAEQSDIKVVLVDAKKEDISDSFNAMMKYTFKLKDEFGKQHTISYDIPKLIDNKFFLINGTKKVMSNQICPIPVTKISNDEVHIVTTYNQAYLNRFGKSLDPKIELIKKFMKKIPEAGAYGIKYKLGDSFDINSAYNTVMEYDDLSQTLYSITIESKEKKKSVSFVFNQHDIRSMMEDLGIAFVEKPELLPIGITDEKEVLYININTGKDTKTGKFTVCDLILSAIRQFTDAENIDAILNGITVPKKYTYTRIHLLNRKIALGVFLGFLYGIDELLKRMGVKYEFSATKKADKESKFNQNVIKLADGYLYYDINPIRHSLILNGIQTEMACESYTYEEMKTPEPYLQTFDELFKTRHMAKGFRDYQIWLMDPFSVQTMEHLGLPTEFLDVILYANSLLEDNAKTDPKKMQINRIRKLELIPVMMYKSMTQSYLQYKYRYAGSKKGAISVKQNDVLKRLMESRLCNDYDTLNPIREVESEGTLTFKGPGGCNVDDAYTLSRRAYDKSMVGVIAASSPDSGSVGITKYLAMNPRITNTRGFVKTGEDADANEIDFGNMGSIAELTTPFAIDHDDPKRLGFVTKESKHVIPAEHTDPLLIGNGVEKVFPFMVSNDFISIAKESGKVLTVDKALGIAVVEYKSGLKETLDIKDRQHKNGGGGFYILNKKEFLLKEGDTFKQNEVLAKNPSYFSNVKGKSVPEYNPGTLSNVAIVMSAVTFEDSSIITERIAEKMSAEIIFCKHITIGAKARVYKMVHTGDPIATGDPLMIFEDEIDDPEINKIIAASDTSDMKGLESIVKHIPKSKISGSIHDVKVYYTVPLEDMSDSVRAIAEEYNSNILKRRKIIAHHGAELPSEIITDYIGLTKPSSGDKINGEICPVGKVLVEVYLKYRDYPGSGDKIVFYASMKTVIHRQLPQELAPYPVGHPERPIDALLSPISVNARMVTSIIYALYGNKLVWALREKVRSIYDSYKSGELKQQKKVSGEAVTELLKEIEGDKYYEDYTLEQTLYNLGYTDEEIQDALKCEGVAHTPKIKNVYICLYNPESKGMSAKIKNMTESIFSHASWSIDSSGNTFRSMNFAGLTSFFKRNAQLVNENLNNLQGIRDKMTSYHIYKLPVTDEEYIRAVELYKEQESGNFKYHFMNLFRIAISIMKNHEKTMKGFNPDEITSQLQVCSSYVASCLAIIKPSIFEWFRKNDVRVAGFTPTNIRTLPGVQFMFKGNAVFEFDRWKELYEKTHGILPN